MHGSQVDLHLRFPRVPVLNSCVVSKVTLTPPSGGAVHDHDSRGPNYPVMCPHAHRADVQEAGSPGHTVRRMPLSRLARKQHPVSARAFRRSRSAGK
jgi:hypothetical protein